MQATRMDTENVVPAVAASLPATTKLLSVSVPYRLPPEMRMFDGGSVLRRPNSLELKPLESRIVHSLDESIADVRRARAVRQSENVRAT